MVVIGGSSGSHLFPPIMKTPDIQRHIVSRQGRAGGDALNLGRVARMRDADILNGTPRPHRRGESGNPRRKRAMLIWSGGLSVATLVVMGIAVSMWLRPHLSREATVVTRIEDDADASVRVSSQFPSPSREQALHLVKRAISNRDALQVRTLFREGGAGPDEILKFLTAAERRDGAVERYEWLSSMDVNGLLMEGVLVVYPGKERPVERLAFLTPDAAGSWKMDFDAYARSVKPTWDELLGNGADQALVRVFAGQDVYYNGPFSDETKWVSYSLASPDLDELLRGYCKVGSNEAAAMERLFTGGQKLCRATLEIRRVKEGGARQFEIVRVVAEDWVVGSVASEGS